MRNHKTKALIGASLLIGLTALAQPAFAQSAGVYGFSAKQTADVNAGVHFKVPFGATRKDKASDQARFGLMLSFDREYNDRNSIIPRRTRTDVMDLGFMFSGEPTMLLHGQDIYTPLFAPVYANGDPDQDKSKISVSKKSVLIAAGAALAAVAVVAVASGDDDDDDDHDDDYDDDDHSQLKLS